MELLIALSLILLLGIVLLGMFRGKRRSPRPSNTSAASQDDGSWWLPFLFFGHAASSGEHRQSHPADSHGHDSGGDVDSGSDGGGGDSGGGDAGGGSGSD